MQWEEQIRDSVKCLAENKLNLYYYAQLLEAHQCLTQRHHQVAWNVGNAPCCLQYNLPDTGVRSSDHTMWWPQERQEHIDWQDHPTWCFLPTMKPPPAV